MASLIEYLLNYFKLLENTTVGIFTAVAVVYSLYYFLKTRNLPPGPIGLPFLGYAPFLKAETCNLVLDNLHKKYGDIFCFNYAGTLYINMGSVKAIRELHINKSECFERMSDFSFLTYMFADGVGFINGEPWKVLRKFSIQQFRESGMSTMKDAMSGPLYDSIKETIDFLRDQKGQPVAIIQLLNDKCTSIIRRTIFGDQGITDQQIKEMNEAYNHELAFMTVPNLLYAGNAARYIFFPFKSGYRNAVKHHKIMLKLLGDVVDEHKKNFREDNLHHGNFIDAFLAERNLRYKRGDPTAVYFSDKALVSTLTQFVGDGVLSVAIFIALFLKKIVDQGEHQEKIYQEIMEVVGQARAPTIDDKNRMPYTNAFILEIIRISEFATSFPSQQCIKDTTIRGYKVPKGSVTLPNMYSCYHDPNIYEEPEKFNPMRFIPKDGKPRPESPNIFGIGKRACIGEAFTMAQVFLFLTTIIQNFKLKFSETSDKATLLETFLSGKVEIITIPRNETENAVMD